MTAARLVQPSDQIQQVEDALNTSQVSGWDVLFAVVVLALAFPVGKAAAGVATRAVKRIPNVPEDREGQVLA